MRLQVKADRLAEFPQCPKCGAHGQINWDEWWCGTEYMEGRVVCATCGWYPTEAEAIEVGLGGGRIFMPNSLDDWVKGARWRLKRRSRRREKQPASDGSQTTEDTEKKMEPQMNADERGSKDGDPLVKAISDLCWTRFGRGWNKEPEYSEAIRANFDVLAREILELVNRK